MRGMPMKLPIELTTMKILAFRTSITTKNLSSVSKPRPEWSCQGQVSNIPHRDESDVGSLNAGSVHVDFH
jgi:hypothetical protein